MTDHSSLITRELLDRSIDYATYRNLIDTLLIENKTTGENHSEVMLDYTRINVQRMKRWDKTSKISEEAQSVVEAIDSPQTWLVLTEAWCGDAAQNMPYLEKLASLNPLLKVRYLLRDENPALMDAFLTNGARSIPKVIGLDEDSLEVLFDWGPRPKELQDLMLAYKQNPNGESPEDFKKSVHLWYAKNKNQHLEKEFVDLFSQKLV